MAAAWDALAAATPCASGAGSRYGAASGVAAGAAAADAAATGALLTASADKTGWCGGLDDGAGVAGVAGVVVVVVVVGLEAVSDGNGGEAKSRSAIGYSPIVETQKAEYTQQQLPSVTTQPITR